MLAREQTVTAVPAAGVTFKTSPESGAAAAACAECAAGAASALGATANVRPAAVVTAITMVLSFGSFMCGFLLCQGIGMCPCGGSHTNVIFRCESCDNVLRRVYRGWCRMRRRHAVRSTGYRNLKVRQLRRIKNPLHISSRAYAV